MQHLDDIRNADPSIDKKIYYQNQEIDKWIEKNKNLSKSSVLTIPVVVHVLWNTSSENISDAQIFSQILMLQMFLLLLLELQLIVKLNFV